MQELRSYYNRKEVRPIKLLNIKTDYVFKRVFGYKGNEQITKNFLSCILGQKVSDIELEKNPILWLENVKKSFIWVDI